MNIRKITATGRPLDFSYLTNKIIAVASLVIFIAGVLYQLVLSTPFLQSVAWAFGVSVTVFLTWALARELDPDQPYSAFAAAGFTLLMVSYYYPPSFLLLFWFLMSMRLVNRTTGIPAYTGDSLILLILTGVIVFATNSWLIGIGSIFVFLLDAVLQQGNKRQYLFALLSFLLFCSGFWLADYSLPDHSLSGNVIAGILVLAALGAPWVISYRRVKTVCDDTVDLLSPIRIQLMQILVFILLSSYVFIHDEDGIKDLAPLWMTFTGAILYKYIKTLVNTFSRPKK